MFLKIICFSRLLVCNPYHLYMLFISCNGIIVVVSLCPSYYDGISKRIFKYSWMNCSLIAVSLVVLKFLLYLKTAYWENMQITVVLYSSLFSHCHKPTVFTTCRSYMQQMVWTQNITTWDNIEVLVQSRSNSNFIVVWLCSWMKRIFKYWRVGIVLLSCMAVSSLSSYCT
jgi:hypothetical protein